MRINPDPFPHAVVDDAFDPVLVRAAADSWPAQDWEGWHAVYASAQQRKRACNRWEVMPEPCRRLLRELLFLDVSAFGLGPLIPDMSMWGGGMHSMTKGDVLGLHLDASQHALTGLSRRLNAVLFVVPEWDEAWGGHLELWDAQQQGAVVRIAPAPGRLVVFETSDTSYHGITQPLACPESACRMSLACWWYSAADVQASRLRAAFV